MAKYTKEFFTDNEVLFVGYSGASSKNKGFSEMVYKAFLDNGIKVYPLNKKENTYDIEVYKEVNALPKVPKCAYLLLGRENAKEAVKELADSGVQKMLFQTKRALDQDMINEIKNMGIEVAVFCPMMLMGSGLHRFHAFLKGIR